jgi:hypothetical protein
MADVTYPVDRTDELMSFIACAPLLGYSYTAGFAGSNGSYSFLTTA